MVRLKVKVVPGAKRNRVVGRLGDSVKVQVTAAPERGKANQAVVAVLADFFGVGRSAITIESGQTDARKRVCIEGVDAALVEQKLGPAETD